MNRLLEIVPECSGAIESIVNNSFLAGRELDAFSLLSQGFARPVYLPALKAENPNFDLLGRCFKFIEFGITSQNSSFRDATYFEALEPLMGGFVILRRSFLFMGHETRKEVLEMLNNFGVDVENIRGQV
ncbi:hypothetical protein [Kitasatospora sp. NPDC057223]|uniref:hypothetical protein n=1 Tax=Kitasatospora sp. NPDC057223 TaxID=3346055 RepID=UPI003637CD65